MSVCSRTLAASGSSPRAAASLTITDSGVFSACARLPTWVRARSTISRLASISALVSRASGAISSGKLPSSRSARAGADRREALRNALERREAEAHLEHGGQQQHDRQHAERHRDRAVEGLRSRPRFRAHRPRPRRDSVRPRRDRRCARSGAGADPPGRARSACACRRRPSARSDLRDSAGRASHSERDERTSGFGAFSRVTCQYQPDSGSSNSGSPSDWENFSASSGAATSATSVLR